MSGRSISNSRDGRHNRRHDRRRDDDDNDSVPRDDDDNNKQEEEKRRDKDDINAFDMASDNDEGQGEGDELDDVDDDNDLKDVVSRGSSRSISLADALLGKSSRSQEAASLIDGISASRANKAGESRELGIEDYDALLADLEDDDGDDSDENNKKSSRRKGLPYVSTWARPDAVGDDAKERAEAWLRLNSGPVTSNVPPTHSFPMAHPPVSYPFPMNTYPYMGPFSSPPMPLNGMPMPGIMFSAGKMPVPPTFPHPLT